jgi:hypothetical protein
MTESDTQQETTVDTDDGIPDFLKLSKEERQATWDKQRAAEMAKIAIAPRKPEVVENTPPPITSPVVTPAAKRVRKAKNAATIATVLNPPDEAKIKVPSVTKVASEPTPKAPVVSPVGVGEGRRVAKANTKHAVRKVSGASQFPKIAALITNKWVTRDVICQTLKIVDNTCRCYLGIMAHLPEYENLLCRPAPRRGKEKKASEYMLVVA